MTRPSRRRRAAGAMNDEEEARRISNSIDEEIKVRAPAISICCLPAERINPSEKERHYGGRRHRGGR
jgi:hypothetical protein